MDLHHAAMFKLSAVDNKLKLHRGHKVFTLASPCSLTLHSIAPLLVLSPWLPPPQVAKPRLHSLCVLFRISQKMSWKATQASMSALIACNACTRCLGLHLQPRATHRLDRRQPRIY